MNTSGLKIQFHEVNIQIINSSKFYEFETVRTLKIQKNDQIWTEQIS